ncbi:MAG: CDP-tyvelose-2-epimerase (CDP-paratose 2-epimerase)-like protein [Labilithrix sp.]|nr:CDP-tyvelose-2-epimerase (CDP-paratose 2-epimerase)-like protein [Labilithrix sp.]
MTVLVTGGAGFVGANVVNTLAKKGERVRVLDNLSRPGVERNVQWLEAQHGAAVELVVGDIRDEAAVKRAVSGVDHVYHFAAQVAVTTSLDAPRDDFDVNALGTLNVLEAIRRERKPPSLVYTSTNKVYGGLADVALREDSTRWVPVEDALRKNGISEARPLSFHSPYGCSKGTADQYVLDYAHTFGIPAVVFRMSCIYGPRQFGTEDQGWVAHFLIRALRGQPITLYGDGKQVRDILFVEDLVDAFERVRSDITALSGEAFNVGGGAANTTSLVELIARIEELGRRAPRLEHQPWRVADQRYYVSDTDKLRRATGWQPKVGVEAGLGRLFDWLSAQPGNSPAEIARTAVAS